MTRLFFLLGLREREQLPPISSPPSPFLPPLCLFTGVCWEAACSGFQQRGLRGPASHPAHKHKESRIWEGHSILHVHCYRDQAMPTCGRKTPPLSTHPVPTRFCGRALGQLSRTVCRAGRWQGGHRKGSSGKRFQPLCFYPQTCSPLQDYSAALALFDRWEEG